ncbi:LysR family transcriptional regulator [Streptomyces sp. NPDC088725]|uniref:LysR family transcriptional regulator n=1 Tax=Streptomyces sp. NPDC088725 TaxID=3365873 RepID=UPI0037F30584
MNLHNLEYFVAVAEELNFTRAAQRLHVVQSGVSAAIRALEKELGVALFERSSQRVSLTPAGEALLPQAHATLEAAQAARDAVLETHGQLRGTLRIGSMTSISLLDVPALLGRYHAEHPQVALRLRVSPSGSAGLAQSVIAGDLDVAFVSLGDRVPAGLTTRDLVAVRMVLVTPRDHRLAGQDDVTLPELADEQFIDSPVGYGNRDLVDRAFAAAGLTRRVSLEAPDIGTTTAYVRHGLGVAFLPEFVVGEDTEDLRILEVSDHSLIWPMSIAVSSQRRRSATLRAMLDLIDQYLFTQPRIQ